MNINQSVNPDPHHDLKFYLEMTFDFFMIFCPSIGFIAQILKFRELKSSEGFSKFLSFIFLIANILRIYFWIGKRFPMPLLFQSIVIIFVQLVVLKECLRWSLNNNVNTNYDKSLKFKNLTPITTNPYLHKPIIIWDLKMFWNWPYLIDYIFFLSLFSLIVGFISHIIGYDNLIYVEVLGVASASVEAIICIPQIFKNYSKQSTESLSSFLIYTWVIGDSIKTFYFVKSEAPMQLIICGFFQLTTDLIILAQIFYYASKKNANKYKSCGSEDSKLNNSNSNSNINSISLEDKEYDNLNTAEEDEFHHTISL